MYHSHYLDRLNVSITNILTVSDNLSILLDHSDSYTNEELSQFPSQISVSSAIVRSDKILMESDSIVLEKSSSLYTL